MPLARLQPRFDQVEIALEVDKPHVISLIVRHQIAVAPLQRRAGNHAGRPCGAMLRDPGGDRLQPRPAIRVGQRLAATHFLDISLRMKAVRIPKGAIETRGNQLPDRRFAGTRYAHDDDGGNSRDAHEVILCLRTIFSENRFPSPIVVEDMLFGIMRAVPDARQIPCASPTGSSPRTYAPAATETACRARRRAHPRAPPPRSPPGWSSGLRPSRPHGPNTTP